MLPNILSLLRLLSPAVILPLFNCCVLASFIVFFISGWTDFFDGFLARKYKKESDFGSVIDPIADKILIFSLFFYFYFLKEIPFWLFFISTMRDIGIVLAGIYLMKNCGIEKFSPLRMSKLNTCLQLLIIFMVYIKHIFVNFDISGIMEFLYLITGVTVVLSSLLYVKLFGELCRK